MSSLAIKRGFAYMTKGISWSNGLIETHVVFVMYNNYWMYVSSLTIITKVGTRLKNKAPNSSIFFFTSSLLLVRWKSGLAYSQVNFKTFPHKQAIWMYSVIHFFLCRWSFNIRCSCYFLEKVVKLHLKIYLEILKWLCVI